MKTLILILLGFTALAAEATRDRVIEPDRPFSSLKDSVLRELGLHPKENANLAANEYRARRLAAQEMEDKTELNRINADIAGWVDTLSQFASSGQEAIDLSLLKNERDALPLFTYFKDDSRFKALDDHLRSSARRHLYKTMQTALDGQVCLRTPELFRQRAEEKIQEVANSNRVLFERALWVSHFGIAALVAKPIALESLTPRAPSDIAMGEQEQVKFLEQVERPLNEALTTYLKMVVNELAADCFPGVYLPQVTIFPGIPTRTEIEPLPPMKPLYSAPVPPTRRHATIERNSEPSLPRQRKY